MISEILRLLVETITGFFCIALLARFVLQAARAPFRNPLGQFIIAVTDWMVRPARRFIPSAFGYDSSSLVLAWLWQFFGLGVVLALAGTHIAVSPASTLGLVLLALLETVKTGMYLVMGVVLISAVFSWVNPYAPMADIFSSLSRPWLRPFRRLIPPIGGVDLTPLALLLAVQIVLIVLGGLRGGLLGLLYS